MIFKGFSCIFTRGQSLDRLFSHVGRLPVLMEGSVWQARCIHAGYLSHKYQTWFGAQRDSDPAAALLGTPETSLVVVRAVAFTGCPVLGQCSAAERAAQRGREGLRETTETGLLAYITTCWILFCWCAQILSGVCSGGGVQAELGVLVGCCEMPCLDAPWIVTLLSRFVFWWTL